MGYRGLEREDGAAAMLRLVDESYEAECVVPGTPLRGCNGMAFLDATHLLVGHVNSARISSIDIDSGHISSFMSFERGVLGADDLTSDGAGTVWTSCATGLGGESIFRIDATGEVSAIYAGLVAANGIQFHRGTGRLFAGQFGAGNGLYELDPEGRRPPRLVTKAFETTNAMDFDHEGAILVTVPGRIGRVDPDTGASSLLDVAFPHNSALKVAASGEIYVTGYHQNHGAVWRVDAAGKAATPICQGVLPPLDNLALSPDGRLFVSSLRDASVFEVAIDGSGAVLRQFSPAGPSTIASMAAKHEDLYLSDGLLIRTLDRASRTLPVTRGSFYERRGFPLPGCLRNGPGSLLYMTTGCFFPLVDQLDARLYAVDTHDFSFHLVNRGAHQGLQLPSALWVDGDAIHVAEFASGQVIALDPAGDDTKRRVVGRQLLGPLGLARLGDRLYVAESLGQRISVIDLGTGRQDVLVTAGLGRPTGLDLDGDGNLLVIDAHGRRLLRVNPRHGGALVIAEGLPVYPIVASHWPLVGIANGLAITSSGAIYVGGNDDGSVWRLTRCS